MTKTQHRDLCYRDLRVHPPDGPKKYKGQVDTNHLLVDTVSTPRGPQRSALARSLFGNDLLYLNLDSPGERDRLRAVPAEGVGTSRGPGDPR